MAAKIIAIVCIGIYAFYGCTSLASIVIPESVTKSNGRDPALFGITIDLRDMRMLRNKNKRKQKWCTKRWRQNTLMQYHTRYRIKCLAREFAGRSVAGSVAGEKRKV
jgi:hypothetical protein